MLYKTSLIYNQCDVLKFKPVSHLCIRFALSTFWPFCDIAFFKNYHQILGFICIKIAIHFQNFRFIKAAPLSNTILIQIVLLMFLNRMEGWLFWDNPTNVVKVFLLTYFGLELLESEFNVWTPAFIVELDLAYLKICDVFMFRSILETSSHCELLSKTECLFCGKLIFMNLFLHDILIWLHQLREFITAVAK